MTDSANVECDFDGGGPCLWSARGMCKCFPPTLTLVPVSLDDANAFVRRLHRHSKPTVGHKFSVGLEVGGELRGVAIAGRPVARALDDGKTIEILRVCTDGVKNGCTRLYGACCRAAAAMGYRVAVTYTLEVEGGASLKASGFKPVAMVKDRQWGCETRPREERDLIGGKVRWERELISSHQTGVKP